MSACTKRLMAIALVVLVAMAASAASADVSADVKASKRALENGNPSAAYQTIRYSVSFAAEYGANNKKLTQLFEQYPALAAQAHTAISADIAAATAAHQLEGLGKEIHGLEALGVLSRVDADAVQSTIRQAYYRAVISGAIVVTFASEVFERLWDPNTDDMPQPVWDRVRSNTLAVASSNKFIDDTALKYLIADSVSRPQTKAEILAALETVRLSRKQIEMFLKPSFPDLAARRLDDLTWTVLVRAPSPVLREDIKDALRAHDDIQLVEQTPAEIELDITEHEFELSERGGFKNRVVFARYDVNFAGALFMMPENSTYQYDFESGNDEAIYAYEVTLKKGSASRTLPLIRGRESFTWAHCGQPVIVNVFGGSQPATFIANPTMQNQCVNQSQRISRSDARRKTLGILVARILEEIR